MCGIAGIIDFKGTSVMESTLKLMSDKLEHRGPDGEGFYVSENGQVGFAHRRLSIIDLSSQGVQPMYYDNERYVITFNGEIYNYIELKSELSNKGYVFKSETDTEVLLAAYAEYKEACLKKLDGMFSLAIYDAAENEIFCARDRFGEKPFYYFKDDNKLLFASEIKALWEAGVKKEVDPKKIYDYLLYGTIENISDQGETFYKNIRALEPASYFLTKLEEPNFKIKSYWKAESASDKFDGTIEEASERFLELLKISISRRLRSDVSVGSSLSGGLDSSSIVTLVNRMKDKGSKQSTFSARFKNYKKDEGKHIKTVVDSLTDITSYQVYPSSESAFNNFEKLVYFQDEPFGSMSINAQFEVMSLAAAKGVKVLLDGQGADEYLAGYTYFYQVYYSQLKRQNKKKFNAELKYFEKQRCRKFKFQSNYTLNSPLLGHVKKQLARERRKYLPVKSKYFVGINPEWVNEYRKSNNPRSSANTLKEASIEALSKKGLQGLLRYADRNSMAHSIELRLPFLYHKLVEFVLSLPDDFLIHQAWTKYVLRNSMKEYLPESIVWRTDKIGYEPPQSDWMKSKCFKDKLEYSVEKLKQEKIISDYYPQLDWNYLMIAEYL